MLLKLEYIPIYIGFVILIIIKNKYTYLYHFYIDFFQILV